MIKFYLVCIFLLTLTKISILIGVFKNVIIFIGSCFSIQKTHKTLLKWIKTKNTKTLKLFARRSKVYKDI